MIKELVQIEFRYYDASKDSSSSDSKSKKITIGVYDSFEEACLNGNNLLEKLESKFAIHTYPDGSKAKKDRFSKTGGCFGSAVRLVTNLAYLKTPFEFFAQITQLKYDDVDATILDVLEAGKRYKAYKLAEQD